MKNIKLSRDCVFGKKGEVVEVTDAIAEQRIKDGAATLVEAPKPKAARPPRKKVNNKAMSAKE